MASGAAGAALLTEEDTYLSSLLRTMLIRLFSGLFFSGMENHVFLPMITTFCLSAGRQVSNRLNVTLQRRGGLSRTILLNIGFFVTGMFGSIRMIVF